MQDDKFATEAEALFDTDFAELDEEQRLAALRIYAEAVPAIMEGAITLGRQLEAESRAADARFKAAASIPDAIATGEALCRRITTNLDYFAEQMKGAAFAVGRALRECGVKRRSEPTRQ
jgi:hypothetical protein